MSGLNAGCDASAQLLMPVAEAMERLLAEVKISTSVEVLDIVDALGRVLAEDQLSSVDVPPQDNSAMDGYALNSADVVEGARLLVSQRIPAGTAPLPL